MLSIDPGDGPGSFLSGEQPHVPAEGVPDGIPLRDIVPPQAMANGGTIIRPGAVAWGGTRGGGIGGGHQPRRRYSSCEAIERALAGVVANPGQLPGLLAELATTQLWVPLPDRQRPFTDGAAVRLPLIGYQNTEFVPCFTSVQRLTAWADLADAATRRAGDARTVPHVVVPAAGLAGRLPAGSRARAQPRQHPRPAPVPGVRAVPRQPQPNHGSAPPRSPAG